MSPSQEYVSLEFISNFKRFNFFHLTEAGSGRENVMGWDGKKLSDFWESIIYLLIASISFPMNNGY